MDNINPPPPLYGTAFEGVNNTVSPDSVKSYKNKKQSKTNYRKCRSANKQSRKKRNRSPQGSLKHLNERHMTSRNGKVPEQIPQFQPPLLKAPLLKAPLLKAPLKNSLLTNIKKLISNLLKTFYVGNLIKVLIHNLSLNQKNQLLANQYTDIYLQKARHKACELLVRHSLSLMLAGMYLAMSLEVPQHIRDSMKLASAERRLQKNHTLRMYR